MPVDKRPSRPDTDGVSWFIGIDPGLSGGLALVSDAGAWIGSQKMPATERDLLDALLAWRSNRSGGPVRAVLERVSASPQMGVTSAFTFGAGFGRLTMALTAAAIPFDLVRPVTWQTAMQCRSGGDKNVTKRRAQQLFPQTAVTHAIADALLLAEYARRVWAGVLPASRSTPVRRREKPVFAERVDPTKIGG